MNHNLLIFTQLFLAYRTSNEILTTLFFSTKVLLCSSFLLKTQGQRLNKNFLEKCYNIVTLLRPFSASWWFSNRQKCRDIFLRRISSNGENTHIIPYVLSNLWIPRKTNVLNSLQIAFIDEVENIIDEQNVAIFFLGN